MSKFIFNQVKAPRLGKNLFDLSHERKMTLNFGKLYPIYWNEVLPGDRFRVSTEMLVRFQPMLTPMMHRVNIFTHWFAIPMRLLWENFPDFITGGKTGLEAPPHPYIPAPRLMGPDPYGPNTGTLADYLGAQIRGALEGGDPGFKVNALPFRAYNMIWNEYFRDQNLMDEIEIYKGDGIDNQTPVDLLYRCWAKDYFTSALPFSQRGAAVEMPLGDYAPVEYNPDWNTGPLSQGQILRKRNQGGPSLTLNQEYDLQMRGIASDTADMITKQAGAQFPIDIMHLDPGKTLHANLQEAHGVTIPEFRKFVKLQEFLELFARAGSRYYETILTFFRQHVPDYRLQRPEYLGGGVQPVVVSEVLQTSQTSDESPQGTMAGHGISVGNGHGFKYKFSEHCIVMGLVSVLPKTAYQDGINRLLIKDDRFSYYWPQFAHIGEQPVYNGELSFGGGSGFSEPSLGTFGYQSRYCEYKFHNDSVHGDFRTIYKNWHLGRNFDDGHSGEDVRPRLNENFLRANVSNRIFSVEDKRYDPIILQMFHNIKAVRPIPKFSTPKL